MPNIRERTKANGETVFHVQVRMAGFPPRTATFSTRRKAERWATTVEAEMIEGRHFRNAEAQRRTLAAAIERYIEDELPKKADQSTSKLEWWKTQIGTLKLSQVTAAVIAEQRDKLARSFYSRARPDAKRSSLKQGETPKTYRRTPATVKRHMAALSHVFTMARKEWHWVTFNPFDEVSKPKEARGRVRFLSDSERTRLLAATATDPTLHTLTVLALSTAARAGELLNLTWHDVDLKDGRLIFGHTKNEHPRSVRVYGDALALLEARSKVRHISTPLVFPGTRRGRFDYSKRFAAALKAAEITHFRFHDLRHSAATYLAMHGASEQQLRAIGGWRSNVVSRYVHLVADDMQSAMQRLAAKIDGTSDAPPAK